MTFRSFERIFGWCNDSTLGLFGAWGSWGFISLLGLGGDIVVVLAFSSKPAIEFACGPPWTRGSLESGWTSAPIMFRGLDGR